MNIVMSALGRYETSGNPTDADCIVGNSFGTLVSADSVNRALAEYMLEYASDRPTIADSTLAEAFPGGPNQVDHVVEGTASTTTGGGLTSWGILLGAHEFMQNQRLEKALLVAQAHHIGRVAMQAKKIGMGYVVPVDLPTRWDPESAQWWTRSAGLWLPRELLGSIALKARGQL